MTDFSKWAEQWRVQHGKSADIKAAVVALPKTAPASVRGSALQVDFKPGDWFDVFIRPESAPEGAESRWPERRRRPPKSKVTSDPK